MPMVKVHEPVLVQGPVQPANTEAFELGAAVNVTMLPVLIVVLLVHGPDVMPAVDVQAMPPVPLTVPVPTPEPLMVTVVALNVALTACAEFMVTEHAPVPLQAPPQPAKAVPAGAVGVNVTSLP